MAITHLNIFAIELDIIRSVPIVSRARLPSGPDRETVSNKCVRHQAYRRRAQRSNKERATCMCRAEGKNYTFIGASRKGQVTNVSNEATKCESFMYDSSGAYS